jgi:hypothetical protein
MCFVDSTTVVVHQQGLGTKGGKKAIVRRQGLRHGCDGSICDKIGGYGGDSTQV